MRRSIRSAGVALGGIVALLTLGAQARAADIFVDGLDGVDDADHGDSPDNALRTIQAAHTRSANGDTILVADGVYKIAASIAISKSITIRALGEAILTPLETSGTYEMLILGAPNIVIDGLTFEKAYGGIYTHDIPDATVRNCFFRQTQSYALYMNGMPKLVENCVFTDCGGGYYNGSRRGHTVRNSTFMFCGYALVLYGGSSTAENCLFVGNSVALAVEGPPGIAGDAIGAAAIVSMDYNAFFANAKNRDGNAAAFSVGPHDIESAIMADAKLVDPVNRVPFLRSDSQLVNRGDAKNGRRNHIGGLKIAAVAQAKRQQGATGFASYAAWKDITAGVAVGSATSVFSVDSEGALRLKDGVTEGTARSPVHDTGVPGTTLHRVFFQSQLDTAPLSGERQVVDRVAASRLREVRIRWSAQPFTDDTTGWIDTLWGAVLSDAKGQHFELEATLRRNGE